MRGPAGVRAGTGAGSKDSGGSQGPSVIGMGYAHSHPVRCYRLAVSVQRIRIAQVCACLMCQILHVSGLGSWVLDLGLGQRVSMS